MTLSKIGTSDTIVYCKSQPLFCLAPFKIPKILDISIFLMVPREFEITRFCCICTHMYKKQMSVRKKYYVVCLTDRHTEVNLMRFFSYKLILTSIYDEYVKAFKKKKCEYKASFFKSFSGTTTFCPLIIFFFFFFAILNKGNNSIFNLNKID